MVIDETPIRAAAVKDYEKAERQIDTARKDLEAFETGDLPAFSRWEARVFGALISELRDLASAVREKDYLLGLVEEEVMWSGCDRVTAYRRVMDARNNPQPPPESTDGREKRNERAEFRRDADPFADSEDDFDQDGEPRLFGDSDLPPGFDVNDYDSMSKAQRRAFHELFESMAEMFEMMTGLPAPDLEDVLKRERAKQNGEIPSEGSDFPDAVSRPKDRLKELYRSLVRRLHPDMNGAHSPRERELWDRLQAAYHARDLDEMEAIAGRLEVAHRGAAGLSIQLLRRMTADLRSALRGLRSQLSKHRKQDAWNFRAKTKKAKDLAKFEKHRKHVLEWDRKNLKAALKDANIELNRLQEKAQRRAKEERLAREAKEQKKAKKEAEKAAKHRVAFGTEPTRATQQDMFPF